MSILNDLFEQIIQSEERIRERFSKLREVSNEIQDYQLKFQDLKDELKSLQGLLVLQNQRLSEEELNLKWFKVRKDVLTQKKTEMLARKENLLQQKRETEVATDSDAGKFTKDVLQFMAHFDLRGKRKEAKSFEATQLMKVLSTEERTIKQDMGRVKHSQEQITSQLRESRELSLKNSQLECKCTALTAQLQNATNQTQLLGIEKQRVALKPHKDPEFKRLLDDLEATRDKTTETTCEILRDELKKIQQLHLKNQLHKQNSKCNNIP